MPFDGKGNFSRLHNWEDDRINDIEIVTDHHDAEDDNFADGLNQCFLRSGLVPMQGDADMGGFGIKNLKEGLGDADAVNKKQLSEFVKSLMESNLSVGDIKTSARFSDHNNWVICDGRALSRTDYASLFAAIGTTFGEGNKSTTFNLPDCRGVVVRGVDNGRGFDSGRTMGSYQQDAAPNINGNINEGIGCYAGTGVLSASGAFAKTVKSVSAYRGFDDQVLNTTNYHEVNLDASRSNAVYGRAAEVRMKNIALNYFIKVRED